MLKFNVITLFPNLFEEHLNNLPFKKAMAGAAMFKKAAIRLFETSGHVPPIEESAKFNNMVINFIRNNSNF